MLMHVVRIYRRYIFLSHVVFILHLIKRKTNSNFHTHRPAGSIKKLLGVFAKEHK